MNILIFAVLWLICSFFVGLLIGSWLRRMDDKVDGIFRKELERRRQREFNRYVNGEVHRLFNEINHPN
jgi:type IV secretory pathway TrbD component